MKFPEFSLQINALKIHKKIPAGTSKALGQEIVEEMKTCIHNSVHTS